MIKKSNLGLGTAVQGGVSPLMRGGVLFTGGLPQAQDSKKEAISGSNHTSVLRPTKESKEIKPYQVTIRTHFREASSQSRNTKKFKVLLIQEGLGNLRDCFFYTKQALQDAAKNRIFEGKKCFADHPSSIEEQSRPERSTRDIIGYFENVQFEEAANGVGMLSADLCMMNDSPNEWALSLIQNALDYSQKYEGSDFIGLSINASGQAVSVPIDQFIGNMPIPEAVMAKINEARAQGITEIRPVSLLKEAISCDLVTEAGAGGKFLKLIEGEKKPMKKKQAMEASEKESMEMEKKKESEMEGKAGEGQDAGHNDAAQDELLFQKMIKQYLGKDEAQPEEMEMAKHAYEAHRADGMEHEAAYEAAGKHMKMASKIGQSMLAKKGKEAIESEASEPTQETKKEECPPVDKKESKEKNKESQVIQLSAENAKLKEALKKYELSEYLDSKLKESKLSNTITKKFREALGEVRSKVQIDDSFKLFVKALEARNEEVESDSGFFFTEKTTFVESEAKPAMVSFSDCIE